jgi:hypothetical protein
VSSCHICGRPATRIHHPTGRGPDTEYLDPQLTIELCHSHHELCHDDWHTFELENVSGPLTVVEQVAVGMRRLALTLARVDAGEGTFWGRLAGALVEWARRLEGFVALLDERLPDWRAHLALGGNGM